MWEAIFVKPVLNLLILIQNYMPGNDLGLAILTFTILVRIVMWPLIKKQIHQTRVMQKLSPEMAKIRAKGKGSKDRAVMEKVNAETMALYRKHGVSPFGSLGVLLIQLPLFIAIYSAVRTAFSNAENIGRLLYSPIKDLSYSSEFLADASSKVTTFADWADLAKKPFGETSVYWPVLIIAVVSIFIQYLQVRQTIPKNTVKSDSDDPTEKLNKVTPYIMVALFGWISLSVEGAISFYLGAGALVAIFQQYYFMKKESEQEQIEQDAKPKVRIITSKSKAEEAKQESKQEKIEAKTASNSKKAKTTKASSASKPKKSTPAKKKTPKKTPGKTPPKKKPTQAKKKTPAKKK